METKKPNNSPDFQNLFESAPASFLVLSPDLTVIAVTNAYLKTSMRKKNEILGRGVFDIFSDTHGTPDVAALANLKTSLLRVLRNKTADIMPTQKYYIPRPESEEGGTEERYWSQVNSPVFGANEQVAYIIHEVEDITGFTLLKKKETGDLGLIQDLREKESLLQGNFEKLTSANKELEHFAYLASHDLQKPLRTISNFAELLNEHLSENPDEKSEQYLKFILNAALKMQTLIEDLLDFSRVGTNFTFAAVDCNVVLETVMADMEVEIKKSNAKITSSPLPVVKGNDVELKRLFRNLIGNAIKFRKKDVNPEITITVMEKKNEYLFSFKDNGIGIEQQYFEKIFVIFERLHSADEFPGSGIGLSTCKKIISLHNGKIWVESQLGEGSVFNFTIPKEHLN